VVLQSARRPIDRTDSGIVSGVNADRLALAASLGVSNDPFVFPRGYLCGEGIELISRETVRLFLFG
jgi:hypothetical protein